MRKLIFSIVVLMLSWTSFSYGDNHQNISLSYAPSFIFPTKNLNLFINRFNIIGGSLEYIRHHNSFKWGIGLEYPSYRTDPTVFLSLHGEWIFQQKSNWLASLGAKIGGGFAFAKSSPSRHSAGGIFFPYLAPTTSFEYLFNETFSAFIGLRMPLTLMGMIGDAFWNIEVPVGIRFYF